MLPIAVSGARNGIRTRDNHLGKVALYQLSYPRIVKTERIIPLLENKCKRFLHLKKFCAYKGGNYIVFLVKYKEMHIMFSRMAAVMAIAAATVLSGCSAIRDARAVHRTLAERRANAKQESAAPNLRGATFAEVFGFAMTNRPSVFSKILSVRDARLALREINSSAPLASSFPFGAFDVSASGGHAESSRSANKLRSRTDGSASAALSLDILLWDFGRHDACAKAQTHRIVAAEQSLIEEGFNVLKETADAYFGWVEKTALLAAALTNEAEFAEHLSRAEEKFKCGEGVELDVLKARLDLAEAREGTVAASNALATAGAELLHAAGITGAAFSAEDVFGRPERPLARFPRVFAPTGRGAADIFAFAATNAPSVLVAGAVRSAADADLEEKIADMYPEISASVSLNWADPMWYWRWGVDVVQSLFTGWRKSAAVDRATVALLAAATSEEEALKNLALEVEKAVAERDSASEALMAAESSVREAEKNLATVKKQCDIGEADRVEYSAAAASCASALGSRASAFCRGQRAEAALFAVTGASPVFNEGFYETE